MPDNKPEWYDSLEKYYELSGWQDRIGKHTRLFDLGADERARVQEDWSAAKRAFDEYPGTLPRIDWSKPPASSLEESEAGTLQPTGTVEFKEAEREAEKTAARYLVSPETDLSTLSVENTLLPALAQAAGMDEPTVAALIMYHFNTSPEAFITRFGRLRQPMVDALAQAARSEEGQTAIRRLYGELGLPPPGEEGAAEPTAWEGGYGAAGVGEGAAGAEYPPGAYFNLLKAQLAPGGPGTAGEFYDAISRLMSPLAGEGDWAEFMGRGAFPSTYMPGSFYTLLGRSALPMGLSMPGEFYGMLEGMMPREIAPGTPAPDVGYLSALGGAPAPELGAFLMGLLQGDPELPLLMMQAALQMQQESAMPFLQLLLGPAAQGGGGME